MSVCACILLNWGNSSVCTHLTNSFLNWRDRFVGVLILDLPINYRGSGRKSILMRWLLLILWKWDEGVFSGLSPSEQLITNKTSNEEIWEAEEQLTSAGHRAHSDLLSPFSLLFVGADWTMKINSIEAWSDLSGIKFTNSMDAPSSTACCWHLSLSIMQSLEVLLLWSSF